MGFEMTKLDVCGIFWFVSKKPLRGQPVVQEPVMAPSRYTHEPVSALSRRIKEHVELKVLPLGRTKRIYKHYGAVQSGPFSPGLIYHILGSACSLNTFQKRRALSRIF